MSKESTVDIQQWVRLIFNNNSFASKYWSSVGPTKKHMTPREQKTIRINSDSADITRVPRPSKSTHHNECKPKQKQTKVGVMSEKPNNTGKTSKGIIARKKKYT